VQTGTLMAAKQISFLRNSEEEQERVEQLIREEVLLISKLQHPHVVRMYGAIQEGDHINVFVEWMPGGSLASLLEKHGVFSESVLLRYLHQTLLGLDYLHFNGILHRDLKGRWHSAASDPSLTLPLPQAPTCWWTPPATISGSPTSARLPA
jgi:mitogen-activated protein kinase kinase kinase 1